MSTDDLLNDENEAPKMNNIHSLKPSKSTDDSTIASKSPDYAPVTSAGINPSLSSNETAESRSSDANAPKMKLKQPVAISSSSSTDSFGLGDSSAQKVRVIGDQETRNPAAANTTHRKPMEMTKNFPSNDHVRDNTQNYTQSEQDIRANKPAKRRKSSSSRYTQPNMLPMISYPMMMMPNMLPGQHFITPYAVVSEPVPLAQPSTQERGSNSSKSNSVNSSEIPKGMMKSSYAQRLQKRSEYEFDDGHQPAKGDLPDGMFRRPTHNAPLRNQKQLESAKEDSEILVPIRIELDLSVNRWSENQSDMLGPERIREYIMWDLNDTSVTPRKFAEIFCSDLCISPNCYQYSNSAGHSGSVVEQITESIRAQLQEYHTIFSPKDGLLRMLLTSESYVCIKIELKLPDNRTVLRDSMLWDLHNSDSDLEKPTDDKLFDPQTPFSYARLLIKDFGLPPSYAPNIAWQICDQIISAVTRHGQGDPRNIANSIMLPYEEFYADSMDSSEEVSDLNPPLRTSMFGLKYPLSYQNAPMSFNLPPLAKSALFGYPRLIQLTEEELEEWDRTNDRRSRRLRRETSRMQKASSSSRLSGRYTFDL